MLNRKLLEILALLTAAEKKRLRLFLTSPYFNNAYNAEQIVRLYDLIIRYHADEKHPALSKEAVFKVFFPGKQFRENAKSPLDSCTTQLLQLVRRFIAQNEQEQENSEAAENLAMARFYRKFAFEERFWQTLKSLRSEQLETKIRDARYFLLQLRIEEEEANFRGLYNSSEDDINLNAVHENLDLYYSIQKLEFTCGLELQRKIAQIDQRPSLQLLESVLDLSESGGPLDIPINRLYRMVLALLQQPDSRVSMEDFESLLTDYRPQIPVAKYNNFQAYYRYFWLQQYHKSGDDFSRRRTFEIYREHLEQGYFYLDGLIPLSVFRNLIYFALLLGELDWVKTFLETHPPERICGTRYPGEIHRLNLADYHFNLKHFEEAQNILVYRHFENPTVGILADILLIKIFYETQNSVLESRMKALDQKIRRSKLSPTIKNRYGNFLRKLDKIVKYGWQTKSPKRARLIEEIKTASEIVAREWLLEKLA